MPHAVPATQTVTVTVARQPTILPKLEARRVTPTLHRRRTLARLAVRLTSPNGVGARVKAASGGPLAALSKKPQRCAVRTGKEKLPATSTLAGAQSGI